MLPVLAANKLKIEDGTKISLELIDELSSNKSRTGQEVLFRVRDNVLGPNKEILIRKNARAIGKITTAKGSGSLGRKGKLEFTIETVEAVDGTKVKLRSQQVTSGKGKGGAMAAVTLLVSPLGLFMKGKNAKAPAGTLYDAYIDEEVMIDVDASDTPDKQNITSGSAAPVGAMTITAPAGAATHLVRFVDGTTDTGVVTLLQNGELSIVTDKGTLNVNCDKIESLVATGSGQPQTMTLNLRSGATASGTLESYKDGRFTINTSTGPATVQKDNLLSMSLASATRELK
jgi:hypothetical protein